MSWGRPGWGPWSAEEEGYDEAGVSQGDQDDDGLVGQSRDGDELDGGGVAGMLRIVAGRNGERGMVEGGL